MKSASKSHGRHFTCVVECGFHALFGCGLCLFSKIEACENWRKYYAEIVTIHA
ncbi:hypothetical protein P3T22_001392 [Paraburkholderia sp. GAS348]